MASKQSVSTQPSASDLQVSRVNTELSWQPMLDVPMTTTVQLSRADVIKPLPFSAEHLVPGASGNRMMPPTFIKLVCETFTIRGVGRLNKGPRFLRSLWLCFVLIMTVGLCLTISLLVKDYLLYDVTVNLHVKLDATSEFPAITVCHHQPFSHRAYRDWRNGVGISPRVFTQKIRERAHQHLLKNEVGFAEQIQANLGINFYYQHLDYQEALNYGHDTSIFLSCMRRTGKYKQIEGNCTLLDGFHIRRFNHHTYFNCYTFDPSSKQDGEDTDVLSLVVGMGPRPDDEQAFITDIFEMARGLR
ncbi:unnamed protein product [Protopolystoma xenopodis]|uniref:Uncharacterized protein n=1 Tax=Protopolystoma xenopodis TaxID=117903 RepID=A0A3S5FG76_9PLAT|nr:unnamed protein product [Protopolystoma xenopodis]